MSVSTVALGRTAYIAARPRFLLVLLFTLLILSCVSNMAHAGTNLRFSGQVDGQTHLSLQVGNHSLSADLSTLSVAVKVGSNTTDALKVRVVVKGEDGLLRHKTAPTELSGHSAATRIHIKNPGLSTGTEFLWFCAEAMNDNSAIRNSCVPAAVTWNY